METAILAIVVLCFGGIGVAGFYLRSVCIRLEQVYEMQRDLTLGNFEHGTELKEIRGVLTEAAKRNQLREHKESPFDKTGDKLSAMNSKRYVSVAMRRAALESASRGPQTHTEHVRENNARAMEG